MLDWIIEKENLSDVVAVISAPVMDVRKAIVGKWTIQSFPNGHHRIADGAGRWVNVDGDGTIKAGFPNVAVPYMEHYPVFDTVVMIKKANAKPVIHSEKWNRPAFYTIPTQIGPVYFYGGEQIDEGYLRDCFGEIPRTLTARMAYVLDRREEPGVSTYCHKGHYLNGVRLTAREAFVYLMGGERIDGVVQHTGDYQMVEKSYRVDYLGDFTITAIGETAITDEIIRDVPEVLTGMLFPRGSHDITLRAGGGEVTLTIAV